MAWRWRRLLCWGLLACCLPRERLSAPHQQQTPAGGAGGGATPHETLVVMATRKGMFVMENASSPWRLLLAPAHSSARALGYDASTDRLLWTDFWGKSIRSARRDGSDVTTVRKLDSDSEPVGLAVDSEEGLVFYSDRRHGVIAAMARDGSGHGELVRGARAPGVLALDQQRRLLFYVEQGPPSAIRRVHYDGSGHRVLVSTGITWPRSLAVDAAARQVTWCDFEMNAVQRVRDDGSPPERVLSPSPGFFNYLCPIALHRGSLFYSQHFQANNSYCLWRRDPGQAHSTALGSCLAGTEQGGRELYALLVVAPSGGTLPWTPDSQNPDTLHAGETQSPEHRRTVSEAGILGAVLGSVFLVFIIFVIVKVVLRRSRNRHSSPNDEEEDSQTRNRPISLPLLGTRHLQLQNIILASRQGRQLPRQAS